MTVERIHPKAPVMLIFIAIFTCLLSCIDLSNKCLNYGCHTSKNSSDLYPCEVYHNHIRLASSYF